MSRTKSYFGFRSNTTLSRTLLSMIIFTFLDLPLSADAPSIAPKLELTVPAGGVALAKITLADRNGERIRFTTEIPQSPTSELIMLGLINKDDKGRTAHYFEYVRDRDSPLYLRVKVSSNAVAGVKESARVRLNRLRPTEDEIYHSIIIPVEILIIPSERNHRKVIITFFIIIASLLFYSFVKKSHFLPKVDSLATSIRPTTWHMGVPTGKNQSGMIKKIVKSETNSKLKRCLIWLRQNPFVIAWPGHDYRELLELHLGDGPKRTTMRILGLRNAVGYLKGLHDNRSRIFVMAEENGFVFLVRRGTRPAIGPFTMDGRENKKKMILVKEEDAPEDGQPAGWRISGDIRYI